MRSDSVAGPGVVVVGVDGSDASKDALRWAVRYARLAGASVDAVLAWQLPATYGWAPVLAGVDLEGDARKALEETVDEVFGPDRPVALRTSVVQGSPAPVLLGAADGADLLVVGSRGHGAFAGMLLGSVSEHCVHHARCPVVVVRHARH